VEVGFWVFGLAGQKRAPGPLCQAPFPPAPPSPWGSVPVCSRRKPQLDSVTRRLELAMVGKMLRIGLGANTPVLVASTVYSNNSVEKNRVRGLPAPPVAPLSWEC
jgi:hypothetical protein